VDRARRRGVFRSKKEKEVEQLTRENRAEILASDSCGCLNCLSIFPPDEIRDWVEDDHPAHHANAEQTALCPHCGESMVLGDHSGYRISPAFLDSLRSKMGR
jgi:hypothetical protein